MLTRSYFVKVPPELNAGKRRSLVELQNEWQATLPRAFAWYWSPFWKSGRFDPTLKTSGPQASFPTTRLGVAHKDTMLRALAGQAQSWTSNLQNRGRTAIAHLHPLFPELRHALYWINSMKLWSVPNAEQNHLLHEQNQALDEKLRANQAKQTLKNNVQPTPQRKTTLRARSADASTTTVATEPPPAEQIAQGESGKDAEAHQNRLQAIPQEATRMLRRWFEHHVRRFRSPDPRQLPVSFSVNAGKIQPPSSSTFAFFNGWATVTTLGLGKRLAVPFQGGHHIDRLLNDVWHGSEKNGGIIGSDDVGVDSEGSTLSASTVLQKTFELHERKGEWYFKLVFKRDPEHRWHEQDDTREPVLALDLGLRNFLASSKGDLRGVDLLDTLYRYDRKVQTIQKGLQNAGVKRFGECQRYRSAIEDLKGFLKTNVRTWLRSILEAHQPRVVVVEKLGFTDALDPTSGRRGLGKTLNRMVRGFGQRVFKDALQQWSQEYGFEIREVDPAYTSQTCFHCDFVHAQNRVGNRFACLACGFKAHADVNAAKVQARRSGLKHTVLPRTRHAWWWGTLKSWVVRLRAQLLNVQPGSPWWLSLVGRARRGVAKLLTCTTGTKAPSKALRQRLEAWLQASDAHLVTTIRRVGQGWTKDVFSPSP